VSSPVKKKQLSASSGVITRYARRENPGVEPSFGRFVADTRREATPAHCGSAGRPALRVHRAGALTNDVRKWNTIVRSPDDAPATVGKETELPGTSKILVVDDDAALVKMLNIRLWVEGYETELAVDGDTAIALAQKHHPDLILLDIAMPGVTGIDVIERLQDSDGDSDIPVLIMTAYPHMIDLVKHYGVVKECFVKPFDLPVLVTTIKDILSGEDA
jgi:CheY-like chemotaxis protein